jgi:hypothetical protein
MTGNSFKNDDFQAGKLAGAWQLQEGQQEEVLIFIDNYCTHTSYSVSAKKFYATRGGPYQQANDKINLKFEFSTPKKEEVGKSQSFSAIVDGNDRLTTDINGKKATWKRLDDGTGALAGNWQITGRMQGDKMNVMKPGARKTIKILSGTRFQWAAINTETAEFSGTGGGKYSFQGGKYTEHIEFFSRDSSRVGASLVFDGAIENGKWIHRGLSSKGDKIHEEWSRPVKP